MSCQVMYQPSQYQNSYFPYQRHAAIDNAQDNKQVFNIQQNIGRFHFNSIYSTQGIVENNEIANDASRENLNNSRESPNTPSQHFQENNFDRASYNRHNGASYTQESYSPQHNNNNMTFGRSSEGRAEQSMPPLIRAGDKSHVSHVSQVVKGEREGGCEEEPQRTAQYLSANCVIFTYYTGDIIEMVDEHFAKALSQASDRGRWCLAIYSTSSIFQYSFADHVPMSARNLPPSFWDCNWVGSPSLPTDPLAYSDHWSPSDPWHNYMAAQMAVSGGSYSAHHMYHNAR